MGSPPVSESSIAALVIETRKCLQAMDSLSTSESSIAEQVMEIKKCLQDMVSLSASESSKAAQGRAMFGMHVWSNMKELDDLDYDSWIQWKLEVEVTLSLMDLDLALRENKPYTPTITSLPEEKSKYAKWLESDRVSRLLIRSKMSNYVRSFVPESKKVKKYFAGIEDLVMKFEKDGANLLSKKLFKMKYDGQGNVRVHILEMCSIASRLEYVGRKFDDELFLLLVIESLPQQFDNFKVVARTKDWELDEFISRCAVFETSIRMDDMSDSVGQNEKVIRCFSCGMDGHHWKNCTDSVSGIKMA